MVTMLPVCLPVPDAISSTNPRVIDDSRARKLSSDLKRCTYYETCATYGLNVERVFQDGKCPPCTQRCFPHAGLCPNGAESSDIRALGASLSCDARGLGQSEQPGMVSSEAARATQRSQRPCSAQALAETYY